MDGFARFWRKEVGSSALWICSLQLKPIWLMRFTRFQTVYPKMKFAAPSEVVILAKRAPCQGKPTTHQAIALFSRERETASGSFTTN